MNSQLFTNYAEAFVNYLSEINYLQKGLSEILDLLALLRKKPYIFEDFAKSQLVKSRRIEIIDEIFGTLFSSSVLNFINLLIDQKLIFHLKHIVKLIIDLIHKKELIKKVELWSAYELDENEQQQITLRLQKKFNVQLYIEFRVDPKLIGGFKIEFDSTVIDNSVLSNLNKIKSLYMRG